MEVIMNKELEKLALNDKELKNLFTCLYVDIGASQAFNEVQIAKKKKKDLIPTPIPEQTKKLKELVEAKGVNITEKEVTDFAIEWGRKNFNFLFKNNK